MEALPKTLHVIGECQDLFDLDPEVTWLIIEGCDDEVFVPDIPGLKTLVIKDCLDVIIAAVAPGLEMLVLDNCSALKYLPSMPESLRVMKLKNCPELSLEDVGFGFSILDLLTIQRCPSVKLKTLPRTKSLHLVSGLDTVIPAYPCHFGLKKLYITDYPYGLNIMNTCTLKELYIKRGEGTEPARTTISPFLADSLTRLEVRGVENFVIPSSMVMMEDLALKIKRAVVLPQMPKLEALWLPEDGAETNGYEISSLSDYKRAWGHRLAKRPSVY